MATNDYVNILFKKLRKKINSSLTLEVPKNVIEKPITNDIGKQIAYYRKMQGITQKELCKKLGTSRSSINAYERREIKLLNVSFLKKIIQALNIENKIILPEYEDFVVNNQSEKLKKILHDNNLNVA